MLTVRAQRNFREMLVESRGSNIRQLEEGIFYVNLDQASWPEIQARMTDIAAAEGVVFDLRGYPKGNHQVLAHLLKTADTSDAWMQVPQIIYPDRRDIAGYQKHGWFIEPREPHIRGRVVFLTDGRAISYAESLLSFVEHYRLGEIVGEPTAGANGNVNPFDLPGGFKMYWTGMKVLKHDGSQHHLIGIRPTIPARRTIQGVRQGRDEFLEKALEIIRTP